tara:strand:- start:311 stop:493 length:183 start_codon:yes stop_codon:yes gene_type:complete
MSSGDPQYLISNEATKDVLAMRKIELLLDVLSALETANTPEVYGIKITVIDKLERAVGSL